MTFQKTFLYMAFTFYAFNFIGLPAYAQEVTVGKGKTITPLFNQVEEKLQTIIKSAEDVGTEVNQRTQQVEESFYRRQLCNDKMYLYTRDTNEGDVTIDGATISQSNIQAGCYRPQTISGMYMVFACGRSYPDCITGYVRTSEVRGSICDVSLLGKVKRYRTSLCIFKTPEDYY